MHVEEGTSRQASTFPAASDPAGAPFPRTELAELRVEVAVLRERVAAAERVLAEREQRIRDLRGSLQIVAAGLLAEADDDLPPGPGSENGWKTNPSRKGALPPMGRLRQVLVDATTDQGHSERP
jgi:hypothetical protein